MSEAQLYWAWDRKQPYNPDGSKRYVEMVDVNDYDKVRDENARLRDRAKSLEGRMRMLSKYMGNGRTQLAHDLVKDTVMALEMSALDGGKGVQGGK